ncbi:hypothetical protein DID75_05580 [Candidatus Marinamargulisbacteria bacterium SCGC AG-410-N11]|nr:hypothetical protein DID75_05580 [Candidatus Marinamargulisbacteria bacterium SCGC AG-410-N11]
MDRSLLGKAIAMSSPRTVKASHQPPNISPASFPVKKKSKLAAFTLPEPQQTQSAAATTTPLSTWAVTSTHPNLKQRIQLQACNHSLIPLLNHERGASVTLLEGGGSGAIVIKIQPHESPCFVRKFMPNTRQGQGIKAIQKEPEWIMFMSQQKTRSLNDDYDPDQLHALGPYFPTILQRGCLLTSPINTSGQLPTCSGFFYDMTFYNGPSLGQLMAGNQLTNTAIISKLDTLITTIKTAQHSISKQKIQLGSAERVSEFERLYIQRGWQRLSNKSSILNSRFDTGLRSVTVNSFLNLDQLSINGVNCQGIQNLLGQVEKDELLKWRLGVKERGVNVHGDLTLSNIIYSKDFFLIDAKVDPNWIKTKTLPKTDTDYDMMKLLFSCYFTGVMNDSIVMKETAPLQFEFLCQEYNPEPLFNHLLQRIVPNDQPDSIDRRRALLFKVGYQFFADCTYRQSEKHVFLDLGIATYFLNKSLEYR